MVYRNDNTTGGEDEIDKSFNEGFAAFRKPERAYELEEPLETRRPYFDEDLAWSTVGPFILAILIVAAAGGFGLIYAATGATPVDLLRAAR